jgi:isoleucyl-tRNA synthetase
MMPEMIKAIGSSLDAKVLLYVSRSRLKKLNLEKHNPDDSLNNGNQVDELRYFVLASQVELVDTSRQCFK